MLFLASGLTLYSGVLLASSLSKNTIDLAFLHTDENTRAVTRHHQHNTHNHKGCFITTTHQNYVRGIRHWVRPCPHRELKHINPYHPPHHKLQY